MRFFTTRDGTTNRVIAIQMAADSYEEERILGMLDQALRGDGTWFSLPRNGQPQGTFSLRSKLPEEEDEHEHDEDD